MGVSLSRIKELQSTTDKVMVNELLDVQASIDSKIDELSKIKSVVSQKLNKETALTFSIAWKWKCLSKHLLVGPGSRRLD